MSINPIKQILNQTPEVVVAWLYGSRARRDSTRMSDYDLAVALSSEAVGNLQVVEEIRYTLSQAVNQPVSLVDINKAPVPLAFSIITEGKVIACNSDLRLRAEQQRVWSLWEEYKYEHERNRQAL